MTARFYVSYLKPKACSGELVVQKCLLISRFKDCMKHSIEIRSPKLHVNPKYKQHHRAHSQWVSSLNSNFIPTENIFFEWLSGGLTLRLEWTFASAANSSRPNTDLKCVISFPGCNLYVGWSLIRSSTNDRGSYTYYYTSAGNLRFPQSRCCNILDSLLFSHAIVIYDSWNCSVSDHHFYVLVLRLGQSGWFILTQGLKTKLSCSDV